MGTRSAVRDPTDRVAAYQMRKGGMDHLEISRRLGYPISTIRNWISKGYRLERQMLEALSDGKENL